MSVGHEWLDIVSGRRVSLRLGAQPPDVDRRDRLCREASSVFGTGRRLVDFGKQGSLGWFEAETSDVEAPPAPMRQLVWPQAVALGEAVADGRVGGHVTIEAPAGAGFQQFCEQLARKMRDTGFVTVRADVPIPYRLRRHLMHRHLVLLAVDDAAHAFAAGWIAQLVLVSDRRHVLIERTRERPSASLRLRPFDAADLVSATQFGAGLPERQSEWIAEAAARSGGWPAAFIRNWSAAAPVINVARERAGAFSAPPPPPTVSRDLARAATYARRSRPAAALQWHRAAVAAAERRGDADTAARTLERWVERLVDQGRYVRAVKVARWALLGCDSRNRVALTILAARAHLAAAEVTRAEALVSSALALEQLGGGVASDTTRTLQFEIMFWQGRWPEIRALLASHASVAGCAEWLSALEWADRGSASPQSDADRWHIYFRPPSKSGRGLAEAIAIAIHRSSGLADPADVAWLDDLVRRERLRGIGRFSEGKSTMQMMRDMAALLEIVQAAEDESTGLTGVCEWVKTAVGASRCAISTAAGALVAGDSVKDVDAHRWAERTEACLEEDETEMRVTATAPVRFAGATIAVIAATGSPGCGRAILDAVQAASAVSGSLVRARLDALASAAHGEALAGEILGASPAIRAVRAAVARVALAPFPVVIEGESGTGKELVARALHQHSSRRDRTFAALNCAALTDDLIEAELFGHTRGAFTHAISARTGLFEEAHRGTLFLDEVGELSPRAQAKLLRTLQEGEIRRVGENEARPVDVRVVAATNRPLATLAAEGRFREDLMFRLSVVRIVVPPLRERSEDVAQLALEFWRSAAKRVDTRATLGPDAIALLMHLPWPGNVRQLQNAMATLAVSAPKAGRVSARLVRLVIDGLIETGAGEIVPLDQARRQLERRVVSAAMAKHTGNRTDAARALGMSRQGLAKALRRLGLAEAGAA